MQDSTFYSDRLYPLQNRVLQIIGGAQTSFYLTGGTALSRGYLQHRFSGDLDMFVNDDDNFGLYIDRLLFALYRSFGDSLSVQRRDERFVRATVLADNVPLKIELGTMFRRTLVK